MVILTAEDEHWACIDETDVKVQDEEQAGKWKAAIEKKAARDAGFTWHEKSLTDLEGGSISYKTEAFYSGWKAGYSGREGKKRQCEGDSEVEHVAKRLK